MRRGIDNTLDPVAVDVQTGDQWPAFRVLVDHLDTDGLAAVVLKRDLYVFDDVVFSRIGKRVPQFPPMAMSFICSMMVWYVDDDLAGIDSRLGIPCPDIEPELVKAYIAS